MLIPEFVPTRVQHFAPGLLEIHEFSMGPLLQLVQVLLDGPISSKWTACSTFTFLFRGRDIFVCLSLPFAVCGSIFLHIFRSLHVASSKCYEELKIVYGILNRL